MVLKRLTPKHMLFCHKYIEFTLMNDQKAPKNAAIASGFSKKTANETASRLLKEPLIAGYVEDQSTELIKETNLDKAKLINELKGQSHFNIQDLLTVKVYSFGGEPKTEIEFKDWENEGITRGQTSGVTGVKKTERYAPDGTRIVETELKTTAQLKDSSQKSLIKFYELGPEEKPTEIDKLDQIIKSMTFNEVLKLARGDFGNKADG